MASCWTSLDEMYQLDKISMRYGVPRLVQSERQTRQANRIARLVKNANFCIEATVEELEVGTARGLSSNDVTDLTSNGFIRDGRTAIIICAL